LYLELRQTERLPAEDLRALQLQKLRRLLQHAYVHVPYYRDAMRAAGVHPEEIDSLDDLRRLPLLSKDDLRAHVFFQLFADDHRKREMLRVSTSGSTGEPLVTYVDRYQLEMRRASALRSLEWTGWRFEDRVARLTEPCDEPAPDGLRGRIDALLMRRLPVQVRRVAPEGAGDLAGKLRRSVVEGSAESLGILAASVREAGAPAPAPGSVVSTAQTLEPEDRALLEEALGARVFDRYGSREFSVIAAECEGSPPSLHVMDESYVVELLLDGRPARPGEVGEVVVTDLNNFSVPLIRYRLGDLATALDPDEACSCGRSLSRIGAVQGRRRSVIECADGTRLPGAFFARFFADHGYAVRALQVAQDEPGTLTLRVVRGPQFTERAFEELLASLRDHVGGTRIDVELVDELPPAATLPRPPVASASNGRAGAPDVPTTRG